MVTNESVPVSSLVWGNIIFFQSVATQLLNKLVMLVIVQNLRSYFRRQILGEKYVSTGQVGKMYRKLRDNDRGVTI
jgi:hypothetical protein